MGMNKTRLGWIRVLLVVSQVVLTIFVVQWLVTRYQDQKEVLTEKIVSQYFLSKEQVLDSALIKNVINPVIRIGGTIDADSLKNGSSTVVAIRIGDTVHEPSALTKEYQLWAKGKEAMFLRSLKLYISQGGDGPDSLNRIDAYTVEDCDTGLFRHVFTDRMSKNGLSVAFNWVEDSAPHHLEGKNFIMLNDSLSGDFPSAAIGKFNSLIIKDISTEILLGVILLLMTASAFIVTFRSLKKQLILNSLRNDFVSNISHELKTPVATVRVALEALRSPRLTGDPGKTSEYLAMASTEISRLEKLVGRVLEQSLLEESDSPMLKESIDISSLLTEIVKGFELRLPADEVRFIFEEQETGLVIQGDRLYLTSVFANLIDNSLKYSFRPALIKIRTCRSKNMACISVEDNGPGIPREYQSKVFDKFFRIPDKRQIKGYGLGLTFARQVIRRHGGSITVRNLEKGCMFTITLPAES